MANLYIIDSRAAITAATPEEAADVYFNLTGFCYHDSFGVKVRSVNEGGVIMKGDYISPILPHKSDKVFCVFRKAGEYYVKETRACNDD